MTRSRAVAAARSADPQVLLLDLTPILCGTRTFAETLGDPLLRRLGPLAAAWGKEHCGETRM
jgi:hypothetical protein